MRITGDDNAFQVSTTDRSADRIYSAKKVILATGYYDVPNLLNVPGEDLPKVIHYYKEPHPYYNQDVLVIGAKNSAAIAALELCWTGARVTLVHRGAGIHRQREVLDQAEHREPHQERRDSRLTFNSRVMEIRPRFDVVLADARRRRSTSRTISFSR